MAYIEEAHSDDEHSAGGELRPVREKPGRNPVVARFFREELNPEAEAYRKHNAKRGQKYVQINAEEIHKLISVTTGSLRLGFAQTLLFLLLRLG
jgi:hypothetical protein